MGCEVQHLNQSLKVPWIPRCPSTRMLRAHVRQARLEKRRRSHVDRNGKSVGSRPNPASSSDAACLRWDLEFSPAPPRCTQATLLQVTIALEDAMTSACVFHVCETRASGCQYAMSMALETTVMQLSTSASRHRPDLYPLIAITRHVVRRQRTKCPCC